MDKKSIFIRLITGILTLCIVLIGSYLLRNTSKKNSVSNEPVQLNFWVWDNVNQAQERNVRMFNNTHDNIKVNMEVISWDNYHDRLLNAISAGSAPDVCDIQSTWIPELVDLDALVQLDDLIKDRSYYNDVYESLWSEIKKGTGDKIYGLPASTALYYLYYRKDLFENSDTKVPETIDQFYEACEKLTIDINGDGIIDVNGFGMRGERMGHLMWMSLTFTDGPKKMWFFDENGKIALYNQQLVNSSKRYIDIFKYGFSPRTSPKDGATEIQQSFLAGSTAMLIHHLGSAKVMDDKYGEKLGVAPIPKGESGRLVPMEMTVNVILETSEHKEEAVEFLKWWSSWESNEFLSVNLGRTPVLKSVAKNPFFTQNRFAKLSMESIPDARLVPATSEMGTWTETVWSNEFQKALLGISTPEELIRSLSHELETVY